MILLIWRTCAFFILALGLSGCFSQSGSYGDAVFKGNALPKAVPHAACDTRGNITLQSNPACVGKVVQSAPDGPSIIVLKPGLAVPVGNVDQGTLAPPLR